MLEPEELKEIMEKEYSISVKNIKSLTKDTYRVKTSQGYRMLVKTRIKPERINFSGLVSDTLRTRGQGQIVTLYITDEGRSYFTADHCFWVLLDWINGRPLNLNNSKEVEQVTRGIARLHKEMEGIISGQGVNGKKNWTKWSDKIIDEQNFIKSYLKKLSKTEILTDFQRIVLDMGSEIKELIKESYRLVSSKECREMIAAEMEKRTVIYRQMKETDILFGLDGQIYFSNPLKVQYDVRVHDLALWIRRLIKKGRDPKTLIPWVIKWYMEERPLSKGEKDWLLSFLIYPTKVVKTIKRYYLQEKSWSEEGYVRKLRKSKLKMNRVKDVYQELINMV